MEEQQVETLRRRVLELEEERLNHAQTMDATAKIIAEMASRMNDYLGAIRISANFAIEEYESNVDPRDSVKQVLKATSRARQPMIKLLQLFSQTFERPGALHLQHLIAEASRLFKLTLLPSENVGVELDLDPECAPIQADSPQMQYVIVTLCSVVHECFNVARAKAGKESRPVLAITLRQSEVDEIPPSRPLWVIVKKLAEIEIRALGIGERESVDQPRTNGFEPLLKERQYGSLSSYGLASVYTMVSALDGEIWVRTTKEEVPTFRIVFPIWQPEDVVIER
mgnify:CR=1 FL=1